ncbi:VOC family protein, partial [Streptomyces thinghirensis]|nr:VOC family protein [Streptomyces thinghirensis]
MNALPALLDHLVLATPDLAATVADFTRRTGVAPAPGGSHLGSGTRNHLVGLGGTGYLEIIGPDPDQSLAGRPAPLVARAAHRPAVRFLGDPPARSGRGRAGGPARGHDPGAVRPMSRRRPDGTLLEWRPTDGVHPSGLVPFLIDWGTTPHPSAGLPVTPLLALTATAPDPAGIRVKRRTKTRKRFTINAKTRPHKPRQGLNTCTSDRTSVT